MLVYLDKLYVNNIIKRNLVLNVVTYIVSGLTITLTTSSAGVLFTIVGAPLAGGLAIAASICGAVSIITSHL